MTPKRAKPQPTEEPASDDIGAQLKRRRTLRGQSLEGVYQHTRIPRDHLEALEANNFDYFPAAIYMRGFLRSYCEYLDIDADPFLERLDEGERTAPLESKRDYAGGAANKRGRPLFLQFSESTLLPFILIAGLTIAGGLLWALKSGPATRESEQDRAAASASRERRHAQDLSVAIEALETSTLSLETEAGVAFEGRLHQGKTLSFTGRGFVLKTSNPGGLRILVDGHARPWSSLPASAKGIYPIEPSGS